MPECEVRGCENPVTKKIGWPLGGGWTEVHTCDDHALAYERILDSQTTQYDGTSET